MFPPWGRNLIIKKRKVLGAGGLETFHDSNCVRNSQIASEILKLCPNPQIVSGILKL